MPTSDKTFFVRPGEVDPGRLGGLAKLAGSPFNLLGRWNSAQRGAKTFLLGSHLDTVRDAGKFDGPLGVLTLDEERMVQRRLSRQRGQHGGDLEGVGTSRPKAGLRPADA